MIIVMHILVKETITITGNEGLLAVRMAAQIETARENDERNKGVIFKNCAAFTYCISQINNT